MKKEKEKKMYKYYEVEMKVKDRIVGGTPKNPEVIRQWIETSINKADKVKKEEIIKETVEAVGADEFAGKMWTGFKSDSEIGLYIEGRQVKAMLKEGANVLKTILGVTAFRSKFAERAWVSPDKIPLGVKEPTGSDERTVHVMTRQGPRSALKKFDYVEKPTITFRLEVLNDGIVTRHRLDTVLDYCAKNGLGAMRSQGEGVIETFKIEEIQAE